LEHNITSWHTDVDIFGIRGGITNSVTDSIDSPKYSVVELLACTAPSVSSSTASAFASESATSSAENALWCHGISNAIAPVPAISDEALIWLNKAAAQNLPCAQVPALFASRPTCTISIYHFKFYLFFSSIIFINIYFLVPYGSIIFKPTRPVSIF
jgi:hypothetical protein